MKVHILTLFPEMVEHALGTSITGRAQREGLLSIDAINIRDYTKDKHKKVDDYPYGGGAGMLMQAQPVYDAWQAVTGGRQVRTVYVTPQGTTFHQKMAEDFAQEEELVILCGHYEGIDERVLEEVVTDYVSIGDYVLTGGELAAMVMVDAVSRLVPGVLNNEISSETESFHGNLLEYPQYSRPEIWHEKAVPSVLLSGNQKKIDAWRLEQSIKRTKERRKDLYELYCGLAQCTEVLKKKKRLHVDMIELIAQGRAKQVQLSSTKQEETKDWICLKDVRTGCIYLSVASLEGWTVQEFWECIADLRAEQGIYLHFMEGKEELQKKFLADVWKDFGIRRYRHALYTNREQLPITGLYRTDGKETAAGVSVQRVDAKQGALATFGCFVHGQLCATISWLLDGSIGLVEVCKTDETITDEKVSYILYTYMTNWCVQNGRIPFVRMEEDETAKIFETMHYYFSEMLAFCFRL